MIAIFRHLAIYYDQGCLESFKKPIIVKINVEDEPEMAFLEDIEQLNFSQTTLDITFWPKQKITEKS